MKTGSRQLLRTIQSLLSYCYGSTELSPRLHMKKSAPALQLDWTVRQRRSKSASRHVESGKKADSTRASPTTPLSWSGATSVSGGGGVDGFEESSLLAKPMESSRSKVAGTSEIAITKRSRKKKTIAELKEEESLLLKERRNLKSELAALRLNVEKHRATNESLKRMKLDFVPRQTFKIATTSVASEKAITDQMQPTEAPHCAPILPATPTCSTFNILVGEISELCSANGFPKIQETGNEEASFSLPDLNLPVEEELGSNNLYGII
ncbi:Major facilitator superfamily domain-containing protein [Quillaja saponaria]|uniref:Major facilitator superfamily domain-containing protein n=1 Tax=Quillaja saponaria TaxID=32244 RepID=A0AAD7PPX6_QUISA|nr:Major facilitator superfamily domain-containing protein [Quillaja saponaria]